MTMERFSHFIQIISGITLIIGVILIVQEMEQTKTLAQAQLLSDYWEGAANRSIVQMGENAPQSIAKACRSAALSDTDIVILSNKYSLHLALAIRLKIVDEIANFDNPRWEGPARGQFSQIFTTQNGREWWASSREIYQTFDSGGFVKLGDEVLVNSGPPKCLGFGDA